MCGIVGNAVRHSSVVKESIAKASANLEHRGPDGSGYWESTCHRVGLAHRRLAIVDLDKRSNQPMVLEERGANLEIRLSGHSENSSGENSRLVIVFNGEIYNWRALREDVNSEAEKRGINFRWQTEGDTEVILFSYLLWGRDCLSRFNGMFAFSIWDRRDETLFFARDRAGKKPLFIHRSDKGISWASEIKALLELPDVPRKLEEPALWRLLIDGFSAGGETLLEGVEQLPPGNWGQYSVESGKWEQAAFWEVPPFSAEESLEGAAAEARFEELLTDSVRQRLEADVPVGVLLSGGVDSSLVACAASRIKPDLKTFTVTFEGHDGYDESAYARYVATELKTDHHELKGGNVSPDILDDLVDLFDHPFIDSSMIPTLLVSRLIREHCTVALGGDGGDELFGGYSHYLMNLNARKRAAKLPGGLLRGAASVAGAVLPTGFRGRNALMKLAAISTGRIEGDRIFDRSALKRALSPEILQSENHNAASRADSERSDGEFLDEAIRGDFVGALHGLMLPKIDRASMAASLEVRSPMLDHRMIEFAFGQLPLSEKIDGTLLKNLPKRVVRKWLPGLDIDRKQGFSAPVAMWLRGEWRERMLEVLNEAPWFRSGEVDRLIRTQDRGGSNSERLFALMMLELWRRKFNIS